MKFPRLIRPLRRVAPHAMVDYCSWVQAPNLGDRARYSGRGKQLAHRFRRVNRCGEAEPAQRLLLMLRDGES